MSLASDVWAAAFKAHFIAFWLFAQSHQLRLTRLDEAQHAAVHGLNAATRLVAQLDEEAALGAQRAAMADPSSGILTIREVVDRLQLGEIPSVAVRPGVTAPNGGARTPVEGVQLLAGCGSDAAARLLCYARAAWLCEELLTVKLGTRTAELQTRALLRRYGADTPEGLPMHATHVCACTECHRVSNAHVTTPSAVPFNELGVSSCQIATECLAGGTTPRLHCAKRSSAALRTALQFEAEMKRRKIEGCGVDRASIARLTTPRRTQQGDTGIASRVRRDAKSALEQRPMATACGEHPMVAVPVVGRAVRIYKDWYALCAYCGALARVKPHLHRYGAEICCLRCDHSTLLPNAASSSLAGAHAAVRQCRFCGVRCEGGATPPGWREVKAPLDVAGPNATLPEPLRRVWYCRQHFRGWITQAHRVMQTRVILAHLVHNAKPLFGADTAAATDDPLASSGARKGKGGSKRKKAQ